MAVDKYTAVWVSHSSMGDFLKCPRAYFLHNVYKDPKTDSGKKSKKGRLDLIKLNYEIKTVEGDHNFGSILPVVFENGEIKKEYTLDQVRNNSNKD